MNLYLVLALALGAISGAVEAPVMRPVSHVSKRDVRAEQRVIRRAASILGPQSAVLSWSDPRTEDRGPRTLTVSARAPALG